MCYKFQHTLKFKKTLSNMKIWNIYSQIVTEPFQKYLENPSKNTI